jgi:hypothetical protein
MMQTHWVPRGVLEPIASRLAPTQSFTDQHSAQGPRFFSPGEKPGPESNKSFDTGVLWFVFTFPHNFDFNLSLTRRLQTVDRIFRYFKANFSALIR